MNAFEQEARERWGDTAAYAEYAEKGDIDTDVAEGLMAIFGDFALTLPQKWCTMQSGG